MRLLTILPLMIFLGSCQAPKFRPLVLCESSFEFNKCRCRCYDLEIPETIHPSYCQIEDLEEFVWEEPIESCDGFTGFHIEDWAVEIIPTIREKKRYYQDVCK